MMQSFTLNLPTDISQISCCSLPLPWLPIYLTLLYNFPFFLSNLLLLSSLISFLYQHQSKIMQLYSSSLSTYPSHPSLTYPYTGISKILLPLFLPLPSVFPCRLFSLSLLFLRSLSQFIPFCADTDFSQVLGYVLPLHISYSQILDYALPLHISYSQILGHVLPLLIPCSQILGYVLPLHISYSQIY